MTGIIVSLGQGVASAHPDLRVGTYVAILAVNPCFKPSCYNCSHGMDNYCDASHYGLNADGAWAAYVTIRATAAIPVPGTPDSIPPGIVSSATDAILTPYHAMKTCCGLQPEHTVLCLGAGGLGLNAISIAKKCLGVRCVIACDSRDLALQAAKEAGADYIATPDTLLSIIAEANLMVDFAFDFVGFQSTFDLCFSALRCGGTIHVLGLASKAELNVSPLRVMKKRLIYKTSYWGSKGELIEILQALADGVLKPQVEMRSMKEVTQVLDDMRDGRLRSRVALFPSDSYDGGD